jgi:DDE superfamily endonuclease
MQVVCNAKRRFLDVYIGHPGATSDFLSFMTSPLRTRLEQSNYLHPGLRLFGDNAYVNTNYMVTPFNNVSDGLKDAFNYYQSQLRISIECAFGMLMSLVCYLTETNTAKNNNSQDDCTCYGFLEIA